MPFWQVETAVTEKKFSSCGLSFAECQGDIWEAVHPVLPCPVSSFVSQDKALGAG